MTDVGRLPATDHICEPGGFYANICTACKIEASRGLYPNGAAAAHNRRVAAERRAMLSVGPMDPAKHYPVREISEDPKKETGTDAVLPPSGALGVFGDLAHFEPAGSDL